MRMKAVENEKKSCIKIEGNVSPFIEKYCNVRGKKIKNPNLNFSNDCLKFRNC